MKDVFVGDCWTVVLEEVDNCIGVDVRVGDGLRTSDVVVGRGVNWDV